MNIQVHKSFPSPSLPQRNRKPIFQVVYITNKMDNITQFLQMNKYYMSYIAAEGTSNVWVLHSPIKEYM
jgi:hypothetical protein